MQCDLCGRNAELLSAIVEGSMLSVCKQCAKFGNVVEVKKPKIIEKREIKEDEEIGEVLVDNYAETIKKARENKGLTQERLASVIAEKESLIHKIESGQFQPTLMLAKKLEQFLRIKLIVMHKENEKKRVDFKNEDVTIGDILKLKDE